MDGFRKGKIPEDIMIKNLGMEVVLEKMAIIALEKEYLKIISEHKIKSHRPAGNNADQSGGK